MVTPAKLEVQNVDKFFGDFQAVASVSLTVTEGEHPPRSITTMVVNNMQTILVFIIVGMVGKMIRGVKGFRLTETAFRPVNPLNPGQPVTGTLDDGTCGQDPGLGAGPGHHCGGCRGIASRITPAVINDVAIQPAFTFKGTQVIPGSGHRKVPHPEKAERLAGILEVLNTDTPAVGIRVVSHGKDIPTEINQCRRDSGVAGHASHAINRILLAETA